MSSIAFLAVFGHTNIDMLARVPRLPERGESMAYEGPVRALGGTAANIAIACARLKVPVTLVSHVGADFPPRFHAKLRAAGVDTRHLVRVRGEPTPVCWIFADPHGGQMCFINQGAARAAQRLPVDAAAVRGSRVVHLATGAPAHQLRAAAQAKRLAKKVAFDPGQELSYAWSRRDFRRMLRLADTIFLNDQECAHALRFLGSRSPAALLRHVDEAVLTHGRKGAQYLSRGTDVRVRSFKPARVVNATGAGDAFRGGYYAALFQGLAPRERLLWGNAAASFAIESPPGDALALTRARVQRRISAG